MAGVVLAGGVVSHLLNQLFDRTDHLITQAEGAGVRLEVEAGIQLRQTIDYARDAYQASMNETLERVDPMIRGHIASIRNLLIELESRNADTMRDLAFRAVQVANQLPMADRRPQLTNVFPRLVFRLPPVEGDPNPVQSIRIRMFGNFLPSAGDERRPALQFGATISNLEQREVQRLEFTVNPQAIFPNLANADRITFQQGELHIPWIREGLGGLRNERLTAIFRISIGALPPSPGRIVLHWTTKRIVDQAARRLEKGFHLCSQSQCSRGAVDCGQNNNQTKTFAISADDNCYISESGCRIDYCEGNFSGPEKTIFDKGLGGQVIYTVETEYKRVGTSGRVEGLLWADQYRKVKVEDHHEKQINLRWNHNKIFNHPLGTWRVVFDAFNGDHHEFMGIDTKRFLKVTNQGGGFSIEPVIPNDIIDA